MTANPWADFEQANVSFCEPRVDAWIVEPGNAWSSMAYLVVGVWLLGRAVRERRHVLLLIATTSFLVGATSFAFHATGTFGGQFFDEASMFFISTLMIALALRRVRSWGTQECAVCYLLLVGLSTMSLMLVKTSGIWVFAGQIGVTIVLEIYLALHGDPSARRVALWTLVATYLFASVVWLADLLRVLCDPSTAHFFSGHIVWHVLTAACLAMYYRYQEQFVRSRGSNTPQVDSIANRPK